MEWHFVYDHLLFVTWMVFAHVIRQALLPLEYFGAGGAFGKSTGHHLLDVPEPRCLVLESASAPGSKTFQVSIRTARLTRLPAECLDETMEQTDIVGTWLGK